MTTENAVNTVKFEVRICPEAICPAQPDGRKYNTMTLFKEVQGKDEDGWWLITGKNRPVQQMDETRLIDKVNPWGNQNANIYRDWCTYSGDPTAGYERKKTRVASVKGFMLDFDSHGDGDMPLAEIGRIIESPEFQAAVPCKLILMTGNGYQIHCVHPAEFSGPDDERSAAIAAYEQKIIAAMGYFKERWGLEPDRACKDITRLHRHYPSFNTKRLTAIDDEAGRIPVRLVLDRKADPKALDAFMQELSSRQPAASSRTKAPVKAAVEVTTVNQPVLPPADALKLALEAPCMQALWDQGAPEGARNACRYALILRLRSCGIPEADVLNLMAEFNSRCVPPESEGTVSDQVSQCYAKPATDPGCKYVYETCKACAFQDKPLETAKATCPFVQKKCAQPKHYYEIGPRGNIVRREQKAQEDEMGGKLIPVTQEGRVVVTAVIDDKGDKTYRGEIINGDWKKPFELSASMWGSRGEFSKKMKGLAGDKLMFRSRDAEHLSLASEYLCQDKMVHALKDFGWNEDFTLFFGTGCVIGKDGIRPPTSEILRGSHHSIKKLRLEIPESDQIVKHLLQHIKDDLLWFNNPEVMRRVIGAAFIAPFNSVLRELAHMTNAAPSLIIQGTTGTGKTSMLLLGARFFGVFGEKDIMSFASTPRVVNDLGYFFKDALYVVDDLKWSSLSQPNQTQINQILQAYVDGHGRSRLLSTVGGDFEPSTGKEIRGTVCISAEDLPTGEASIFGRYMITPLGTHTIDRDRMSRCLQESKKYNMVMAEYLRWYMAGKIHGDLIAEIDRYRCKFETGVPTDAVNTIRVCTQLALNLVGYRWFLDFGQSQGVFEASEVADLAAMHEAGLMTLRDQRIAQISSETPADKFLSMVMSLLAAKKVKLFDGSQDSSKTVIGFREDDPDTGKSILYLNASAAFGAVQTAYQAIGEKIPFSLQSLGEQLKSRGYLAKCDSDGRATYTKGFGGTSTRCYAIKEEMLDWEGKDKKADEPAILQFPDPNDKMFYV